MQPPQYPQNLTHRTWTATPTQGKMQSTPTTYHCYSAEKKKNQSVKNKQVPNFWSSLIQKCKIEKKKQGQAQLDSTRQPLPQNPSLKMRTRSRKRWSIIGKTLEACFFFFNFFNNINNYSRNLHHRFGTRSTFLHYL